MASSHIDWEQFDMILGEPEEETIELLNEFQTDCREIVSRLAGHTDQQRIGRDLHQLKGVSLNMGFSGLADIAATAEQEAKSGRLASPEQVCQSIESELQAALDELRRERPGFFA